MVPWVTCHSAQRPLAHQMAYCTRERAALQPVSQRGNAIFCPRPATQVAESPRLSAWAQTGPYPSAPRPGVDTSCLRLPTAPGRSTADTGRPDRDVCHLRAATPRVHGPPAREA